MSGTTNGGLTRPPFRRPQVRLSLAFFWSASLLGCALDARFIESTPGEDYEISGAGGKDDGDGGTAGTGGDGAAAGTGGDAGSGGDGAAAGTGGDAGSGGDGGTGGTGGGGGLPDPVACEGDPGPLVVSQGYADNGTLCGFGFLGGWGGATAKPSCGGTPCSDGERLCADLSVPAADATDANASSPSAFLGLYANQTKAGDLSYWKSTDAALVVDFSIGSGTPGAVRLEVETVDGRLYCVNNVHSGVPYHVNEFTHECLNPQFEAPRLGPDQEVLALGLTVASEAGVAANLTDVCINDVQLVDGLPALCAAACTLYEQACGAGYPRDYCKQECQQSPADYAYCLDAWEEVIACETRLPPTGFSCADGIADVGPDYDCFDEVGVYSACISQCVTYGCP